MRKLALLLLVLAAWTINESASQAQVGYVTYYQPVTVYRPAPCCGEYVAPAPAPVVAAPVVAAPVYAPVVRTRYRPILGGTVTRVFPRYHRAYYAPVVYGY